MVEGLLPVDRYAGTIGTNTLTKEDQRRLHRYSQLTIATGCDKCSRIYVQRIGCLGFSEIQFDPTCIHIPYGMGEFLRDPCLQFFIRMQVVLEN